MPAVTAPSAAGPAMEAQALSRVPTWLLGLVMTMMTANSVVVVHTPGQETLGRKGGGGVGGVRLAGGGAVPCPPLPGHS